MKRWKKGLLAFSVMVGCLITGASIKASAEEAFPQITLNYNNGDILKECNPSKGGREYTINISQKDVLSKSDFEKLDGAYDAVYIAENFGEITFTLKEGADSSDLNSPLMLKQLKVTGKEFDELVNISQGATLVTDEDELWDNWADDCGNSFSDNGYGKFLIGPKSGVPGENDRFLLICFIDSDGTKYAVQYKIKVVFPPEYIVRLKENDRRVIDISNATYGLGGDYLISLEGNTYLIKPYRNSYSTKLDQNITFTPRYACGAKGKEASSKGAFTVKDKQHLSETGYPFTVTNIEGKEKTFYLKVDMPWELKYESVRNYIKNVYA